MKKFGKFAYVALAVGALMLFITLALWNKTRHFIARAATAPGVVTELIEVRDNDGSASTFKPVVKFTTASGQLVSFTSSYSSRPPAYDVGENVTVLYSPGNANDARIKGFASLWLGTLILLGLGLAFSGIGASIVYAARASVKKQRYLQANGERIHTDVQGVDWNTDITLGGKHPWRVTSQWLDPSTNKMRVFHSEDLWFDPTRFITGKQVVVLLDPHDPKRYMMDLSFLPKLDDA